MPNGVGNSYSIGMNPNITSEMGMRANKEVSAANWQSGVQRDKSVAATKAALMKYARRLLMEDKMRILSQQAVHVSTAMSDEEINEKFVEMLVVNLPQKEVDQLIQQSARFDTLLKNDMSQAQSNLQRTVEASKRAAREAAAIQKQQMSIQISGTRGKSRFVKEFESQRTGNIQKQAKVTRYQIKGFNGLRKELEYILNKVYFKGDVYRLAIEMGIDLQGGEAFKPVCQSIIQRVIAYVSVMLGKTPKYIGNMMTDIKPFRELLRMTSYAYVTGTPGQSIKDIQEQQKAALAAKQQAKVMARSKVGNWITRGGARRAVGRKFLGSPFAKKLSGMLENMDNYELMDTAAKLGIPTIGKNLDRYKLGKQIQNIMADRYARQKKLEDKQKALKRVGKISSSVDAELKALRDTNPFLKDKSEDNSTDIPPVKFNKAGQIISNAILKAMPVYVVGYGRAGQFKEDEPEAKDDDRVSLGGKIGGFFKNIWHKGTDWMSRGRRIKDQINDDMADAAEPSAVDMSFIPGVGGKGGVPGPMKPVMSFEQFAQHYFPEIVESYTNKGLTIQDMMSDSNTDHMKFLDEEFKKYTDAMKKRKGGDPNIKAGTMSGFDFTDGVLTRLDTIISLMGGKPGAIGFSSSFTEETYDSILGAYAGLPELNKKHKHKKSHIGGGKSKEAMITCYIDPSYADADEASIESAIVSGKAVFKQRKDGGVKKLLSKSFLEKIKRDHGVNPTKAQNSRTINVHGGGGSSNDLKDVITGLKDITEIAASIDDFLNMTLPIMMSSFVLAAPMGVGAMTNPAALAMIGTSTAASAINTTTKTLLAGLNGDYVAHAKGGSGRYVGPTRSGGTQFISGDSLNGKENKELVNIDWDNKTYHVKPIPKFATGGSGNSGNTKVTGITSSERGAPMSVGISGPVAKHSFIPEGVTDMGEDLAVKVINVTPGIYDIHPTYGMSAMDVLVAMSGSLGNIAALMTSDLELQKIQAASLQAIGASSAKSGGGTSGSVLGSGFTSSLDGILAGA